MWELPAASSGREETGDFENWATRSWSNPNSAKSLSVKPRDASQAVTSLGEITPRELPAVKVEPRAGSMTHRGSAPWGLIVSGCLAVLIFAGAGFYFIHQTDQRATATERPRATVVIARPEAKEPARSLASDPITLPAPEGTVQRMNNISKSFSKK